MNLWIFAAVFFSVGLLLVGLLARFQHRPLVRTVAETAIFFVGYTLVTGLLVAFNLFLLDRIDPFFTTSRWYVFGVLYWPSWVLIFAPLIILGSLLIVAFDLQRASRILALALLLLVTSIALETVFLLDIGAFGILLVQVVILIIFTGVVYKTTRTTEPYKSEHTRR